MIEMIQNERGFFIEELNAAVICDLHIGYERELAKRGVIVKENTKGMVSRIKKILKNYKIEKLIILGDVKHSIGGYERNLKFLEDLDVDILIAKGNHDGNIEKMGDFKVYSSRGFRLGEFGFFHGHSWPDENVMKAKYVFMGHLHPQIELRDSNGNTHKYPCHLIGSLTEKGKNLYKSEPRVFVVAAFNPLVGSADVEIGPLFRNNIVGDFDVYLINGTYLGKYETLKHGEMNKSQ